MAGEILIDGGLRESLMDLADGQILESMSYECVAAGQTAARAFKGKGKGKRPGSPEITASDGSDDDMSNDERLRMGGGALEGPGSDLSWVVPAGTHTTNPYESLAAGAEVELLVELSGGEAELRAPTPWDDGAGPTSSTVWVSATVASAMKTRKCPCAALVLLRRCCFVVC